MDGDLAIRTDGYGDATLHDELPITQDGLPDGAASATPDATPAVGESPSEAVPEPAQAVGTEGVPAIVFGTPAQAADDADGAVAAGGDLEGMIAQEGTLAADGESRAADVVVAAEPELAENATPVEASAEVADAVVATDVVAGGDAGALVAAEVAADAEAPAADLARLEGLLESLLLAAGSPVPLARLVEVVDGPARRDVVAALKAMGARYEQEGRGMRLVHVGGGWQLRSAPEHGPFVRKLLGGRPPRLSRAMLETLAIVAYRQPCTKPEIEAIRGVDADATLNTLLERRMVRITGRKEAPGRPLLYATTREFLEVFGLPDLHALPPLAELGNGAELLAAPDLTVGPNGVHPTPAAELGFRSDDNGAAAPGGSEADAVHAAAGTDDAVATAADAEPAADNAEPVAAAVEAAAADTETATTAQNEADAEPRADGEAAG